MNEVASNVPHKDDHAFYNPSGAHYWMECSGFAALKQKMIEDGDSTQSEPTEYMLEGTEAHDWIDKFLAAKRKKQKNRIKKMSRFLKAKNPEMHFHVFQYLQFLKEQREKFLNGAELHAEFSEHKVHFSKDNWGTLDRCIIRKRDGKLQALLIDFKYGKGVPVSAEENEQLLNYLVAKNREYKGKITRAWLIIYQPRIENEDGEIFTKWAVPGEQIAEWSGKFESRLKVLDEVRFGRKEAEFHSGAWCQFCPANGNCPQIKYDLRQVAFAELDKADAKVPALRSLTLQQKINIFKHRKIFIKMLTSIAQDLQNRLQNGLTHPELKLVNRRTNRRWKDDHAKIALAIRDAGMEPWKRELINITAARTVLSEAQINKMTEKPEGRLQLALASDTKSAVLIDDLPDLD